MQKKLTISIDEAIYDGLYRLVGPRRIGQFIEGLVRPHVIDSELDAGYRALADDEQDASEALEWSDGVVGDVDGDSR